MDNTHLAQPSGLTDTGCEGEGIGMLAADGGEVTTQLSEPIPEEEETDLLIGDEGEGNTHEAQLSGTVVITGQEVETGHSGGGEPVNIDFREIDYEDMAKVDEVCRNGCGCSINCAMQFSANHYLLTRSHAQQMHRKELDMVLMGQVMAFTFCSQAPQNSTKHRHHLKNRERNTAILFHNGLRVCKKNIIVPA